MTHNSDKSKSRARVFGGIIWPGLIALTLCLAWVAGGSSSGKDGGTGTLLPDGREFVSWEQPLAFTRTYYVDNRNSRAADSNPGTKELPFLTINKAAQVLRPGERVVIIAGVYRERVDPAHGGSGPDKMISYEAAPGANVIVKGSRLVTTGWKPSAGFKLDLPEAARGKVKIYERRLDDLDFQGYNPFGMASIMQNRVYLKPKPEELWRHLKRRGMVFVDGRRLDQAELYQDLGGKDGVFWCEHDGLAVHVRLPGDSDPAQHEVELAIQEQIFAPRKRGLSYIRVKGITFEHAANAFPVPQRGMVSLSRGHHWIVEDCVLRHANGVALDIGAQDWDMEPPAVIGHAIVRRNHIEDAGVCGIAGMAVQETLIESNLIERVGYQDVELAWETGGIKLHSTKNCLLCRNVIRHTLHAEAIWLDYENTNTRVTANVMGDTLETLRGGVYLEASHDPNMIDNNIIWKATEGAGGGSYNMPPHGGWGITVDGSDETVIAHNLIGFTQDAAIKFRNIEGRIVSGRGGTTRRNKVLNNIFYRCGKAIDFSNLDNTADGNLYTKDWGDVRDETQPVGRGLNWVPDAGTTLRLDLEAWQKFFGFDKNGAYADMSIDVDLDGLTMAWSVKGVVPQGPVEKHFQQDLTGQAAGNVRMPGPLVSVPDSPAKVNIDPRHAKKKTALVITFDVEDYITPESERIDDIPKWLAEIMTEEGVTGTFFVIGEKARSLEKRGRRDVIAALAKHEIGSHTNFGSIHPAITEELEKADWEEGVRRMFAQESAGFKDLERIFGTPITILARHGGSYGPQLVCALGRMKAAYQGSPASLPGRDVVWFCNALNFSAQYDGFDDFYYRDDLFEPVFEKLKAEMPEVIQKSEVLALFAGHPTKIRAEEFWDFNFYFGNNPSPAQWKTPRLRPAENMATAQKNFRRMMRYLKSRDDIEITTYRALLPLYSRQKEFIMAQELSDMAAEALETNALSPGEEFSPAEAFAGLARSIAGYGEGGTLPGQLETQHPLGPREMPVSRPEIARVTFNDFMKLAREADAFIRHNGALPAALSVGKGRIGTGSLFALFSAGYLDIRSGKTRAEYSVPAFDPYPKANEPEIIRQVEGYKSWPVHRRDLDMARIVEFTGLQLWTLKPARRS